MSDFLNLFRFVVSSETGSHATGGERLRVQSLRFGTKIFSKTLVRINLSIKLFKLFTDMKEVEADTVINAMQEVTRWAYGCLVV